MSRTTHPYRVQWTRQTWFAWISILMVIGMIGLAAPGMGLTFYFAVVGVMLGAAIAVWGLTGWARRETSAYVAALSLLHGIGLMLLSYSIARPLDGPLTALAWTLVFAAPSLRIRHESMSASQER